MSTTKVTDALRNVTAVDAAKITTGTVDVARLPSTVVNSNVDLTTLSASNLTSGTVADARFPATLPATSGVNLTALNGSNIGSGTVPTARLGTGTASSSTFLRGDSTYAAAGGTTLGTPIATTSGTSHSFTGIPSGTKRITVNFDKVDTNGTQASIMQLGDSGGFETSGYIGTKTRSDTGGNAAVTTGMAMMTTINNVLTTSGSMVLTLLDASTFTWASTCMIARPDGYIYNGASVKSLSGELTQIKLLQESGSSAYDGGKMNILYE